jgi:aryl-alcohol dehydrogenase-like predicted oxidoreductase
MRHVTFGSTGLAPSALGFGCAAVGGRKDERTSLRALASAWDKGVRYFDTARSYGYGDAERILGSFLRGRRHEAVVATKFGISVPRASAARRVAKDAARFVFDLAPGLRRAARPMLGAQHAGHRFTPASLRESLDASLRELGTDRVDVLHLHDPAPEDLDSDELWAALEQEVSAGRVGAVGVAGAAEAGARAWARIGPRLGVWQLPLGWLHPGGPASLAEAKAAGVAVVAYAPLGGEASGRRRHELLDSLLRAHALETPLGAKLRGGADETAASVAFGLARAAGADVVLASAFDPLHLAINARAASEDRFSPQELAEIRAALGG